MYKVVGSQDPIERNGKTMVDLPIVGTTREAWARINVEQLASTRATSAVEIAVAVRESPGHPYPCSFKIQISAICCVLI